MVVPDRCDHGYNRRECIRRIEPAAETGFEDDQFAFAFLEMIEREGGGDFKKGRMRIPVTSEITQRAEAASDFVRRDHFAVDANPLTISDEVRGGEETRAITSSAADRVDHGAGRAFAIGPGDMDD